MVAEKAPDLLPTVHVEIRMKGTTTVKTEAVMKNVSALLARMKVCYSDFILKKFDGFPFLNEHIISVAVSDLDAYYTNKIPVPLTGSHVQLHVFHLMDEGPAQEELEEEEDLAAASHWVLPCTQLYGLWESLVFDTGVKAELLQYAATTLLFSDRNIDCNVISWNRVVLLHGPPGTGKTSLCRALAQKLTIQLSQRYDYGQLIEINSHSLFSKWFSESGKLVLKMFQKIQEFTDDPRALVCILIDEVESLTAARKSSLAGTEPSDAIRVVNALLTQLDQIKSQANCLVLTTSNITGAIDLAFVDRADIKQYIGLPGCAAIYKIFLSCIAELIKKEIISPAEQLLDLSTLSAMQCTENSATQLSLKLKHVAIKSEGLSGRTLRKLPFIAHAMFLQSCPVTMDQFLDALLQASVRQFEERDNLGK
ncbi:hypothetical protein CAPTEDRAFT_163622 [Capitella teleta]|uniref:Pachytene checkpoint protein 2 homolog n=1 Tax=Capitella teleta TaxID=283909 RepID=R7UR41_CAPTE|nr:hypothetical protein CAPTEDRAFT_163622 [Capitella teleta]|eukprot:ELU08640.1 hypothetical protein CAPTEDRAFT_163622 [Capitella teleta]